MKLFDDPPILKVDLNEIPHQRRRRRSTRKLDSLQSWHVQHMCSQLLHHASRGQDGRPHSTQIG